MSNSNKTVVIDAMSGTDSAQILISQFTDSFDTVRFCIDEAISKCTLMIVTETEGVPAIFEVDGKNLYTEYDKTKNQHYLVWKPGREITCTSGLVVYQIAAYSVNGEEITSTWYSREGRIVVSDSIDTTAYSAKLIGSHPNLITRLILETGQIRALVDSLAESKIDKQMGYQLFSDGDASKLSTIEYGAEVNTIEKVKVDGTEIKVDASDRSVNIDLKDKLDSKVDKEDNKWLSTNDFTDEYAMKLESIEEGAQKNVSADRTYSASSSNAQSGYAVAQAIANAFSDFVGSSPAALDTVYELADALQNNTDVINQLLEMLGLKIEKVKVDGEALAVDSSDKSVNIDLSGKVDKIGEYMLSRVQPAVSDSAGNFSYIFFSDEAGIVKKSLGVYNTSRIKELLDEKVDKSDGMGLSSNDFTDEDKEKLEGISAGAEVNVQADWNEADKKAASFIKNKPIKIINQSISGGEWDDMYFNDDYNRIYVGYISTIGSPYILFAQREYAIDTIYRQTLIWNGRIGVRKRIIDGGSNSDSGWSKWIYFATTADLEQSEAELRNELNPTPITKIPTTLIANKSYNFGALNEALNLEFPTSANDGDVIYLTFETGDTAINLSIDTTNTSDIDISIEANTGYEIFGKFNGTIWIVSYSEYTVTPLIAELLPSTGFEPIEGGTGE